MQRREDRGQDIGIVLDLVKVIVVFVVIVGAFVGVEIFLQLGFQRTVGGFGGKNVRVLRLIAGCRHTAASRGACGVTMNRSSGAWARAGSAVRITPTPASSGTPFSAAGTAPWRRK